jgi:hypothetical protein
MSTAHIYTALRFDEPSNGRRQFEVMYVAAHSSAEAEAILLPQLADDYIQDGLFLTTDDAISGMRDHNCQTAVKSVFSGRSFDGVDEVEHAHWVRHMTRPTPGIDGEVHQPVYRRIGRTSPSPT